MSVIIIGSPAVNRPGTGSTFTCILMENPSPYDGKITEVQVYSTYGLYIAKAAIFYRVSGDFFSTRDYGSIGDVPAGTFQSFEVDLNIKAGDYIGIYFQVGKIDRSLSGYAGYYYLAGDYIPCTELEFTNFLTGDTLSLRAIGETLPPIIKDTARTGIYTFKTLK